MTGAAAAPRAGRSAAAVVRRRVSVGQRQVDVWTLHVGRGAALSGEAVRLAERLAADVLEAADEVRVASLLPSGRPVVLRAGVPAGCGLSISHLQRRVPGDAPGCHLGLVAAACCRDADVGLDIVAPADAAAAALAPVFTSTEQAETTDARQAAFLWAAKEAAYKASGLDEAFRPRRIVIGRQPESAFTWSVTGQCREVRGVGSFVDDGDHVLAIAVTEQTPQRGSEAVVLS